MEVRECSFVFLVLGTTSLETTERAHYLAIKMKVALKKTSQKSFFFLKKKKKRLSLKDESNICLMRKTSEGQKCLS